MAPVEIELTTRPRPAFAPGKAFAKYTRDGTKLIAAGDGAFFRIFTTGDLSEPFTIDVKEQAHLALAVHDDFFILGSEEGLVTKYLIEERRMDAILLRSTLPIRDIAISPDGLWVAVASDELNVKLVSINDMTKVVQLKEHKHSPKHLTFDMSGSHVAVTCTDGIVYVYSITSQEPKLIKSLDGVVPSLSDPGSLMSSAVMYHPDGRALIAPTPTRNLQSVSTGDWKRHKAFQAGHNGELTAAAISPNGALLLTGGSDNSLSLWNVQTQEMLASYKGRLVEPVTCISWHPTSNEVTFANADGKVWIYPELISDDHAPLLRRPLQPSPLNSEPLSEISNNIQRPQTNGHKANGRAGTPDSLDDLLDLDNDGGDGDDFIVDDDGAGYAEVVTNGSRKRPGEALERAVAKRPYQQWQPRLHQDFQPGSTPWRGNRRYLCLNLVGFVWTVDLDSHHTITVEFFDRGLHRDFHFTDAYLYDRACITEQGTAFSCPSHNGHASFIYYRPHETWTARTDWRVSLPPGEEVTSLSLSSSFLVVTTSAGYVRIYTLFGVPYRVYGSSSSSIVASSSWRDYVFSVYNGTVMADGRVSLLFTIDDVKHSETHQTDATLPLPADAELSTIFWSDAGDPYVYTSHGVLLVCQHWRTQGQAKWVPLLDTRLLDRLATGKKEENYWPVAVTEERFYCIILKGGERQPYFPRPLLNDFAFEVPIDGAKKAPGADGDNDAEAERRRLEESYVRQSTMLDLQHDLISNTKSTSEQRNDLARRETELDKTLIQLMAHECREGEDRGMKALEIASLLRDRSGRTLEAASRVALKFKRNLLSEKITDLAERRLLAMEDGHGE